MRSVIRPSTPEVEQARPSRRGSSTVHTCTGRPAACARATNSAVTMRSPRVRCGTCSASPRPASTRAASGPGANAAEPDPDAAVRRRDRPADQPPEVAQPALGERADAHPVVRAGALDEVGQQPHRDVGLEVDVPAGLGQVLEQVGHPRDAARVRRSGRVRRSTYAVSTMLPTLVGDPVQDVVVEGEQHLVARGVHVGLQVGVAQPHRVLERHQGVLQPTRSGCSAPPRCANASTAPGWSRPASRNGSPVCGRVTRAVSADDRPVACRCRALVRHCPARSGVRRPPLRARPRAATRRLGSRRMRAPRPPARVARALACDGRLRPRCRGRSRCWRRGR